MNSAAGQVKVQAAAPGIPQAGMRHASGAPFLVDEIRADKACLHGEPAVCNRANGEKDRRMLKQMVGVGLRFGLAIGATPAAEYYVAGREPAADDKNPGTEARPFKTIQLTVPVGKDRKGTLYRSEWILDRAKHDVPVESITLRGADKGVPIILGFTGVTQW